MAPPNAHVDNRSGSPGERTFNTEEITRQLLRVLQPLRVESLSLHDGTGQLLWLNDGVFGPDEHGGVLDALDIFALDSTREELQLKFDNERYALFSCARNTAGELCGLALAMVEAPTNEDLTSTLAAPRVGALIRRLSQLLVPETARPSTLPSSAARTATRASKIHARCYGRLRQGGDARRYEVKAAPNASFETDLTLATQVIEHLQRSRDRYHQPPASFAIPLSVAAITQGGWLSQLQPALERAELAANMLGFCLPSAAWANESKAAEQFIAECTQAECFVALDDFNLGNCGFELLRYRAVHCLKLEPQLISAVVHDKFAHATLAAIVQAARVLGLYCVAKQIGASQVRWLAAAGIEFSDGINPDATIAATTKSDQTRHGSAGGAAPTPRS